MISDYYGHAVNQCESANFIHGTPPDCCTECTGDCPGWGIAWGVSLAQIENNWNRVRNGGNFSVVRTNASLTWDEVRDRVGCSNDPVQVHWQWTGGGGHIVTIYGYSTVDDQHYVSYNNPWPPDCKYDTTVSPSTCSAVAGGEDAISLYDTFVNDGVHTWRTSFSDFVFQPSVSSDNLLLNPDASEGTNGWTAYGAATLENCGSDDCFVVRNQGYFLQDVSLSSGDVAGQYALLIGRASSERVNADGSITGLPYLYGYMIEGDHINTYLQGQEMLSQPAAANKWVLMQGIFPIPAGTDTIRFFLNQAERQGDPQNGSAARFDDLGLFIRPTEEQVRELIEQYRAAHP